MLHPGCSVPPRAGSGEPPPRSPQNHPTGRGRTRVAGATGAGETATNQTIKGAGSAALRSAAFVPPPARRRRLGRHRRPRPRARSPEPRRPHAPVPAEPPRSPAPCPSRRRQRRTATGPGGPRWATNGGNQWPRPASWVRWHRAGAAPAAGVGSGLRAAAAGGPLPAARCGCRRGCGSRGRGGGVRAPGGALRPAPERSVSPRGSCPCTPRGSAFLRGSAMCVPPAGTGPCPPWHGVHAQICVPENVTVTSASGPRTPRVTSGT